MENDGDRNWLQDIVDALLDRTPKNGEEEQGK